MDYLVMVTRGTITNVRYATCWSRRDAEAMAESARKVGHAHVRIVEAKETNKTSQRRQPRR